MAPATISHIVYKICKGITHEYIQDVLQRLITPDGWKKVAKEFAECWNLHHTAGTLDGEHIALFLPGKTGSLYYNYRVLHSLVLLALVDSNFTLLYMDVGADGATSDVNITMNTLLKEALEDKQVTASSLISSSRMMHLLSRNISKSLSHIEGHHTKKKEEKKNAITIC